jgi:UDP:flavonoid glycosyltransferase YjiC (YdhE family)
MRFLMTTHRGAGHFGPMIPFAHAMLRAGHEVLVAVPRTAAPMVVRAGLEPYPLDEPLAEIEQPYWEAVIAADDEGEASRVVVVDVFGRLRGGAMLPGLLDLVAGWRPDVVIHEITEIAAVAAAERHGVPHVRLGIGLVMDQHWGLELLNRPLEELRARVGVRPDPLGARLSGSPFLTQAPRSLEQPFAGPDTAWRFRAPLGGGSLPDWWPGNDDPLVYISFGTAVPEIGDFPGLCRATIGAVADLPIRVLLTVGNDHDPADLGPLPPSVHVERWVPQADVMPHAAAMVGHGGSGSTLMAMAAGVPLAVVPFFADQPANAQRIAELGAGIALPTGLAAIEQLPDAIGALLHDRTYARRAGLVAADIAELPPVDDAVAMLEDFALGRALAA